MLTRLNGGCRIGIVLWGWHFVEYISNIDGERIFAIAVSRLTVSEERRLIARSSSGACLWVARLVCAHQLQALMASG